MCLCVGERIGMGLGRKLMKACAITKRLVEEGGNGEDGEGSGGESSEMEGEEEEDLDDGLGSVGGASSIFSTKTSLMSQGATADCVLLVAGRRLYCHKVVVSRRCNKLRDMIYDEHRGDEENLTELILPDLRFDVARCLLQFLYLDDIIYKLDARTTLPRDLMKAAEDYGLKRLVALCKRIGDLGGGSLGEERSEGGNGEGDEEKISLLEEIPQSTLPMDLGGALGVPVFGPSLGVPILTTSRGVPLLETSLGDFMTRGPSLGVPLLEFFSLGVPVRLVVSSGQGQG